MVLNTKHRMLALLLALVLCTLSCASFAESNEIASCWTEDHGCMRCTAVYARDGAEYEIVLCGVRNVLSDEELCRAIDCVLSGESCTLTDNGIIDAEKFSRFYPTETGSPDTWLDQSGIRSGSDWGDSHLCWAGSAANMLFATGWAQRAVNPDTALPFRSEDEVFSYFAQHFYNNGAYQWDAIRFFFTGSAEEAPIREEGSALLDVSPESCLRQLRFAEDADAFAAFDSMLDCLKEGALIGIAVDCNYTQYPLTGDPETTVSRELGRFSTLKLHFSPADDPALCTESFSFDDEGNPVLVHPEGEAFADADGNLYDAQWVKRDVLLCVNGKYLLTEPEEEGCFAFETVVYPESEVALDKGECTPLVGNGGHAITVCGAVRNADGERIALLITDTDDDANIARFTDANIRKEDRPNRIQVCPVHTVEVDGMQVLSLQGYIDGEATLCTATLLLPE